MPAIRQLILRFARENPVGAGDSVVWLDLRIRVPVDGVALVL